MEIKPLVGVDSAADKIVLPTEGLTGLFVIKDSDNVVQEVVREEEVMEEALEVVKGIAEAIQSNNDFIEPEIEPEKKLEPKKIIVKPKAIVKPRVIIAKRRPEAPPKIKVETKNKTVPKKVKVKVE